MLNNDKNKLSSGFSREISFDTLSLDRYVSPRVIGDRIYPIINCFFTEDGKRHKRTFKQLLKEVKFSKSMLSRWLRFLREQGYLIERTRRGKRGNPKYYFLKLSSPEFVFSMPERKAPQKKTENVLVVYPDMRMVRYKITKTKRRARKFSVTSIDLE